MMAHRVFTDSSGRKWEVWTVVPQSVERRRAEVAEVRVPERRKRREYRVPINERWRAGWLAFESAGERRRLAPIPEHWATASDAALENLCSAAYVVKGARRVL